MKESKEYREISFIMTKGKDFMERLILGRQNWGLQKRGTTDAHI